ncbi:MAG: hypothetical protein Q7S74_05290 [Nanoarchaeota archaeon]|nr:hypothetical protein [Nanoarchaeota archaeon]
MQGRLSRTIIKSLSLVTLLNIPACNLQQKTIQTISQQPIVKEENSENRFLDYFPSYIPGAAEVRKYKTDNTKYNLVHILQRHLPPYDECNTECLERVAEIQNNIYLILDYLTSIYPNIAVYPEGIYPSDYEGDIKTYSNKDGNEKLPKIEEGAALVMYKEQKIREIKKTEKPELHKKSLVLLNKIDKLYTDMLATNSKEERDRKREQIEKLYIDLYNNSDQREDYLLKLIKDNFDTETITVFGAKHAFGGQESCGKAYCLKYRFPLKDNISEWNKSHPEEKFSLIEIIPETLEEYLQTTISPASHPHQ